MVVGVLLCASVATAADKVARVAIPAADRDRVFMVAVMPVNADGTVNVVIDRAADATKPGSIAVGRVPRSIVDPQRSGGGAPVVALVAGTTGAAGAVVRGRVLDLLVPTGGARQQARLVVVPLDSIHGQARNVIEAEAGTPGFIASLKAAAGPAAGWEFKGRKSALRHAGDSISDFELAYVADADRRPLDADGNPKLYPWAGARNIGE
jgi:hypothetical protein